MEVREISKEELAKIVKEVMEKGEWESRFLLILDTQSRPGGMFCDRTDYQVLYGEVEEVELDSYENYPHASGTTWLIIPKTVPVVIRYWHRDDLSGSWHEWQRIYVFTKEGWKSIEVK